MTNAQIPLVVTAVIALSGIVACSANETAPDDGLVYNEPAIETCLTLRVVFGLALRQTEGFVASILKLLDLDLPVPDHTTLSRRGPGQQRARRLGADRK